MNNQKLVVVHQLITTLIKQEEPTNCPECSFAEDTFFVHACSIRHRQTTEYGAYGIKWLIKNVKNTVLAITRDDKFTKQETHQLVESGETPHSQTSAIEQPNFQALNIFLKMLNI